MKFEIGEIVVPTCLRVAAYSGYGGNSVCILSPQRVGRIVDTSRPELITVEFWIPDCPYSDLKKPPIWHGVFSEGELRHADGAEIYRFVLANQKDRAAANMVVPSVPSVPKPATSYWKSAPAKPEPFCPSGKSKPIGFDTPKPVPTVPAATSQTTVADPKSELPYSIYVGNGTYVDNGNAITKWMIDVVGPNYEHLTYDTWHSRIGKKAKTLGWDFDHLGADGMQLSRMNLTPMQKKIYEMRHFRQLYQMVDFLIREEANAAVTA